MTGQSLGPPLHLGESPGTVVASPWERPLAWPAGRTRRRRRVPGGRLFPELGRAAGRARGPVFPSPPGIVAMPREPEWPRGDEPSGPAQVVARSGGPLRPLGTEPLPKREVGGGWLWARPANGPGA